MCWFFARIWRFTRSSELTHTHAAAAARSRSPLACSPLVLVKATHTRSWQQLKFDSEKKSASRPQLFPKECFFVCFTRAPCRDVSTEQRAPLFFSLKESAIRKKKPTHTHKVENMRRERVEGGKSRANVLFTLMI